MIPFGEPGEPAGGPLHWTIGDELFEIVDRFNGAVFLSRQLDFTKAIEEFKFDLPSIAIEEIRNWMENVRLDYDDLSAIVGEVAAQVQARTGAWHVFEPRVNPQD